MPTEDLDEQFFALAEDEDVTDVEELNRVLDRAVGLRTFLGADDRVEQVAEFVAEHFRENVDPLGYKAFLVAVDRETCAKYKRGARPAPAARVVGGRLQQERRPTSSTGRTSPSCSSPRRARRRSAGCSRSRPSSPRS